MSSSPQYEKALNGGESTPDAALIREQLKRILAHPLFSNSKRYPVLLAYTVEQTLDGNAGELKERTIGIEAFGREPDYDVNIDPVVRMTAAEVRKDSASTTTTLTIQGSSSLSFRSVPTSRLFMNLLRNPSPQLRDQVRSGKLSHLPEISSRGPTLKKHLPDLMLVNGQ